MTNNTCFNTYESESFWRRKLKQDYPDVTHPKEISVLELYKRLTNEYGFLVTLTSNNHDNEQLNIPLYKAIITTPDAPVGVLYVIDEENNLSVFSTTNKPITNLLDKYLQQFFPLDRAEDDFPLAKNIKYISSDSDICFILTTDGTLYQIVITNNTAMPSNVAFTHKKLVMYDLVVVDHNVTEVGSSLNLSYYIKKPNLLYVSDINPTEDAGIRANFELVSDKVKFVASSGDYLNVFYIEKNGSIYQISEHKQIKQIELTIPNIIQIYDNHDENGITADHMFVIDKNRQLFKITWATADKPIITKVLDSCLKMFKGPPIGFYTCALTSKYELYDIDSEQIVQHQVLNYFYDADDTEYVIKFSN